MTAYKVQFEREKTALKFFLIGRGYNLALKALGFAERHHVGLRKDGNTPEFHHQVRIALTISQLKGVINEEMCIVIALLHDVQEDYHIPREVLVTEFGEEIAGKTWKMTKKYRGESKTIADYIQIISLDPDTSIAKGCDRNDNLASMIGVFTPKKIYDYAHEAETVFLPMLKRASKMFPEQMPAYHAISQRMKELIKICKAYSEIALRAAEATEIVKNVNNSVFGSQGYFTMPDCVSAIEDIKAMSNRNYQKAVAAEARAKDLEELSAKVSENETVTYAKIVEALRSDRSKEDLIACIKSILGVSDLQSIQFNDKPTGPIPSD